MSNKRYCSNCGDRISHKATSCSYCGQRVWNARLVIRYVAVAVILVTIFFLLLDFYNIEFFK